MSILGSIFSKILGKPAVSGIESPVIAQPGSTPRPQAAAPIPRMDDVDVAALLDERASQNKQKLDWRHSIVDMMKLLGMDSGLEQRKALAKELGYTGDTADSAKMNLWLHEQVIKKLSENGGKVPADLLH